MTLKSEVETTQQFFLNTLYSNIFTYYHLQPMDFLNWGLEVDVDILNFLAVFKRIFMDISLF